MSERERDLESTERGVGRREGGSDSPSIWARDPFERLFRLAGIFDDGAPRLRSAGALSPQMDVEEDEECYEVSVELPGLKQEDVSVELHHNVLSIRGEKRSRTDESTESRRRSHWTERSYGRFVRSFTLPPDADPDAIKAAFSNGLLTIQIPKSEQSKPRSIDVKTSL